jgi:hypothetical protein
MKVILLARAIVTQKIADIAEKAINKNRENALFKFDDQGAHHLQGVIIEES